MNIFRVSQGLSITDNIFKKYQKIKSHNLYFKIRYKSVSINNVFKKVKPPRNYELVPKNYLTKNSKQETLKHFKWMLQKDLLGQDMFLIGAPGLRRRNLVMSFLELTEREVEFIALSRDTTEADLKQRKEIKNGTSYYHDQSALKAAIKGRVLILEGIEKAERNVLPILNNLLENREMHLEDGRLLIPASRYDKLLKDFSQEKLNSWRLIRVSEDFRVIALGLPANRYSGHPLDPPLRSRFQALHIPLPSYEEQLNDLKNMAPNANKVILSQLLSCCHALVMEEAVSLGLPDFPLDNLTSAAIILNNFPSLSLYSLFYRFYPYNLFLKREGRDAVESILKSFGGLEREDNMNDNLNNIIVKYVKRNESSTEFTIDYNDDSAVVKVPHGSGKIDKITKSSYIETFYQNSLVAQMIQSQSNLDLCLIGPKGCGKSITVQRLAELLGYQVEPIMLYQDMTSRDLIQYRTTLINGDTVWKDSPLVTAAIKGKLALLDGLHRVHPSTLAVIHRLVHDRELQLHDGKRLLRSDRYDEIKAEYNKSDEQMKELGVYRIHSSFKIIAIGEPPILNSTMGQWLTAEVLSLFIFHEMRYLNKSEELHIIKQKYGNPTKSLLKIIELAHYLRSSKNVTLQSLANSLSTRQLLRIAARMQRFPNDGAYDTVYRACLARFLPTLPKQAFEETLKKFNILPQEPKSEFHRNCIVNEDTVIIGNTTIPRYKTCALTKVPDVLFYNIPQHLALLEQLLQDFTLGQNLLLIGNQGVGKNKIVDRLLQLLNRPREYIQLHRDTTIQTLTAQPMVRDGVVVYEDSPLVQAVKLGHVLIVDEADKAPTHVTCILKTLVESKEMILSDGRRIIPLLSDSEISKDIVPMHQEFRMIVLANRPGFPFLGNDFFGAIGDLFSTHYMDNPSFENEIKLLKKYGLNVDEKVLYKLVKAFGELRNMADQGLVSYPYSTREVINIVKHLQKFPDEPIATVVMNVFDFDKYSQETFNTLVQVVQKHGIPIGTSVKNVSISKEITLPDFKYTSSWNFQSSNETISVLERFLKFKYVKTLKKKIIPLDKIEARSTLFSEMKSYWKLPMYPSANIVAFSVYRSNNKSSDNLWVLATNPLTLFETSLTYENIRIFNLQDLITPLRSDSTLYHVINDKEGNILVHEGTSNTLLSINPEDGKASCLKLSVFDYASDKLSEILSNRRYSWKLKTDLLLSSNQLILFTPSNSKIEIVDLNIMSIFTMNLPFAIESLIIASSDKWLLQNTLQEKFILKKSEISNPCPNLLKKIYETKSLTYKLGSLLECNKENLESIVLQKSLIQDTNSSNRILVANNTYATIVTGFSEDSLIDVFSIPRNERMKNISTPIITEHGLIIRAIPSSAIAKMYFDEGKPLSSTYLEIVDLVRKKLRYIPIPEPENISPHIQWFYDAEILPFFVNIMSNKSLVTIDVVGCVRLWDISFEKLEDSFREWKKMVASEEELRLTKERESGLDVSTPKHGKIDPNNEPHVGGNTWAGGTGGRDTAGLGGKGGPYRFDAGHTVHQLSDAEKETIPDHVKKAAHEMGQKAFKQRLKEIHMSEYDHKIYNQLSLPVQKEVQATRVILENLQAKSQERQWCRHQTSGELDDTKLIEGLTGEKTIYRRRAVKEPEISVTQIKPKRFKLVVDVSGSMYRFNGYDGRLTRELEACVMMMEAFDGYEDKFQYDIIGHSGDDYRISFVDHSMPLKDNKRRLEVIQMMHAHSQFCNSGDYTLEATKHAISTLAKEDSDESIVVVLSDANLERYGIRPETFTKILMSDPDVSAYVIFIGSLGDSALRISKEIPFGRGFVCMDLKNIPRILNQIFTASVLSTIHSS